jgi:hypothetical protein
MPAYSLNCPECRTTLKSARPIPAGKLLECPKCQVLFAAPAPKPKPRPKDDDVIEDVEVVDDVEVIEDVEVVEEAPARRGAGRAAPPKPARTARKAAADPGFEVVDDEDEDDQPKRRPRPKRKSGGNKGLVIGLVAAAVLLVLGAGGGLAYWLMSGGSDDPIAYVPADSQIVFGADGQALLNSSFGPQLEQLLNSPVLAQFTKYKQDTKAQNRDLFQRVVVSMRPQDPGSKGNVIIKSGVPWDAAKLAAAFGNPTKKSVGGYSAYQVPLGAGSATVLTPHKSVAVVAEMTDDKLGPTLKGKSALIGDMATLTAKVSNSTVWFVAVPDAANREQFQAGMNAAMAANPAGQALLPVMRQAKGFALWATLTGGEVEFKVGMLMPDAAAAQQAATTLQTESKKSTNDPAQKMMMALMPAPVKTLVDEMTASQQFTADGALAVMSAKCQLASLQSAIGEAAKMATMFGGPGAAPMPPQPPGAPPAAPQGPRGGPGGGRGGRGKGGGRP